MQQMQSQKRKPVVFRAWISSVVQLLAIAGAIVTVGLIIWAWYQGYLHDIERLQELIRGFGWGAPLAFLLIQYMQVIVPIVPGSVTLAAGVLLFGPLIGFIYNYLAICAGSVSVFLIARRYGPSLVRRVIGDRVYDKYIPKISTPGYYRFFTLAIFFPFAPDDALCYLTGLSDMGVGRFTKIILLAKPLSIAIYSFFLLELGEWVLRVLP